MSQPPPIQQPPLSTPPAPRPFPATAIALIVVAVFFCGIVPILAIVAAILFPVVQQAKASSLKAHCAKNLKGLSLGALMYAEEHDGALPLGQNWNDALMKHVGDGGAIHCPGAPNREYGYAFNDALCGVLLTEIAMPKEQAMIFDSSLCEPNAHSDLSTLTGKERHVIPNIAYADGRVKPLKLDQVR